MDGLKIIIEVKEERISELEDRAIEITQSGKQKLDPPPPKKVKVNRAVGTRGTITKALIFVLSKSQNKRKKEFRAEKELKRNNGCKHSKLGKGQT